VITFFVYPLLKRKKKEIRIRLVSIGFPGEDRKEYIKMKGLPKGMLFFSFCFLRRAKLNSEVIDFRAASECFAPVRKLEILGIVKPPPPQATKPVGA